MMHWIWLILAVMFLIAEASTVTMVSLWFAIGSLAALVVALLGGSWGLQIGIALVVSAGLLACLRPMVKKHFTPKLKPTNVDAIIGSQGYVTAEINNLSATGKVKLGAMEWTARSTAGTVIPEGTLIQVDKIEGVKVFVTPVEVKTTV